MRRARRAGLRLGFYVYLTVDEQRYKAHRVAWALHYGEWPKGAIDHINGDGADNRIANLRDVDTRTNQQNQRRAKSNNSTGWLGVYFAPKGYRRKRFRAGIARGDGTYWTIGYFATAEEAHAAYVEAKRKLHAGCTI